jgi:hypothetical protein
MPSFDPVRSRPVSIFVGVFVTDGCSFVVDDGATEVDDNNELKADDGDDEADDAEEDDRIPTVAASRKVAEAVLQQRVGSAIWKPQQKVSSEHFDSRAPSGYAFKMSTS